jgi:intracellular sulfur oxidation DsrE/DsrF family protein
LHAVVVAHNAGIEFLLRGARDENGRPYEEIVRDFRERGVEFRVCGNTLKRRRIDTTAVIPEAVLVPSGIAELARLQGREGYVYLRL